MRLCLFSLIRDLEKKSVECCPFITLYLESIGMDRVMSELCYKGIILQRHYRKLTMKCKFYIGKP